MEAKIAFSPKKLRKSNNDTLYFDTPFQYKVNGEWNEMEIGVRARGNFRRATCYYPPVKVDLKKKLLNKNSEMITIDIIKISIVFKFVFEIGTRLSDCTIKVLLTKNILNKLDKEREFKSISF